MSKQSDQNLQIHECTFEASIKEVRLNIKFSCRILVNWRTPSNKLLSKTQNQNTEVKNNVSSINEALSTQSLLLYDKQTRKYHNKQTVIIVYLTSKRKPEQERLVGKLIIDLSQVLNNNAFSTPEEHLLNFCSVKDGSITFSISVKKVNKTELHPNQVQLDSFSAASLPSKAINWSASNANEEVFSIRREQTEKEKERQKQKQIGQKQKHMRQSQEHSRNVNQLKAINQQLNRQINKIREQNKLLEQLVNKDNSQINYLKGQIRSIGDEKNVIVQELMKQINDEVQDKTVLRQQMHAHIQQLQGEMRQVQQKYNESRQTILENEDEMLQLKFKLSQLNTQKEAMTVILSKKEQQIKSIKKERQNANKRDTANHQNKKNNNNINGNDILQPNINANTTDNSQLIVQLKQNIQKYQQQLQQLNNSMKANEGKVNSLQEMNGYLNSQIQQEIKKNNEFEGLLVRFAEKERKMKESIQILQDQSNKIYDVVIEKEDNQHILTHNIRKLQAQLTQITNKHNNKQLQVQELKKEMYNIRKQKIQNIHIQGNGQDAQQYKYEEFMNLSNRRIQELQQEVNAMKEQYSDKLYRMGMDQQQYINKVNQLQTQLNTANSQNRKYRKDLGEYEEQISDQKNMLNGYIQKIQDLQQLSSNQVSNYNFNNHNHINHNGQAMKENELLKLNINKLQKLNKQQKEQIEKLRENRNNESQSTTIKHINHQLTTTPIDKNRNHPTNKHNPNNNNTDNKLPIVCRQLKQILKERQQKKNNEKVVQSLTSRNIVLENRADRVSQERGNIQETARKLSMQFQKIKSSFVKAKGNMNQRKQYLQSLKPCEGIVRQLVHLAQHLKMQQYQI